VLLVLTTVNIFTQTLENVCLNVKQGILREVQNFNAHRVGLHAKNAQEQQQLVLIALKIAISHF